MGYTSNQKTRITRMVVDKIEAAGGRFISINWKNNTVHYLDKSGNKKFGHPEGRF